MKLDSQENVIKQLAMRRGRETISNLISPCGSGEEGETEKERQRVREWDIERMKVCVG
jgi:hypothetical protein